GAAGGARAHPGASRARAGGGPRDPERAGPARDRSPGVDVRTSPVRARYEVRVGRREALALAAALAAMTGVVFGAGILVGRGMGRPAAAPPAVGSPALGAAVAMPRKSEPPPADPAPKTAAARAEERLTFYKTLTSPTTDLPPVGKPTIEEHLVPREEPAAAPPEAPAPGPRPA